MGATGPQGVSTMSVTTSQLDILKALAAKSRVVYGGAQDDDTKALVRAGYVKETAVNLSEVLYEITDVGRKKIN
jgi:hypothetical protein